MTFLARRGIVERNGILNAAELERIKGVAMRAIFFPISALLLSVAILITGNGLQWTLIPVRANIENFSPVAIGLLGSSYYLGFALGCVGGGRLVQRAGHVRAFSAFASIASVVTLLHSLTIEPVIWWCLRLITGFCFAGLYLIIESWLNERASNKNRGLIMGIYTMITLLVNVVGQMLFTLGDPKNFALFAAVSILISLAVVPVALTGSTPPAPLGQAKLRPIGLYRCSPVGVVGVFFAGVATGAFWSLGPTYVIALGADTSGIAIFMSIAVLGGALVQWPVGRFSDTLDRRLVVITASLVGAVAALILSMLHLEERLFRSILAAIFGASALPLYAICVAHAFDHTAAENTVETSSGLLLANGLGAIAGPLAAAFLMRAQGPGGLFVATAGAHLMLVFFVAWRMTVRTAVPIEQRNDFCLATTAPTMVALTPESS
ncbi:MFS transporter [Mesorhizobium sp. A623]